MDVQACRRSIPHNLGKAEATRRLQGGLGSLKTQFGDKIASVDESWREDRMAFRVGAMGQSIAGHLDVMDDQVVVEVRLPWLLAVLPTRLRISSKNKARCCSIRSNPRMFALRLNDRSSR